MKAIMTGEDIGTTIGFRTFGPYEARHPWPEETVVSAGSGIVFRRKAKADEPKSYTTLFMEVYPPGASFIRGEGITAEECEDVAWAKYQLALHCSAPSGQHQWEPRGYRNGAGFCAHCNTFKSEIFSGEDLGQYCEVCGVGTTDSWGKNEDGSPVFHCNQHYIRPQRGDGGLGDFLASLLEDEEELTTTDETSTNNE